MINTRGKSGPTWRLETAGNAENATCGLQENLAEELTFPSGGLNVEESKTMGIVCWANCSANLAPVSIG